MKSHSPINLATGLVIASLLALISISTTPAWADRTVFYKGKSYCGDQYRKWETRKGHWMGFAINERIGRKQSCGSSLRALTKQRAIAQAMSRCREMSRKHPELGHPNSCFLYDIK